VIETYKAFQTLKTASPGVASGLGAVGKAAGIAGVIWAAASALEGLVDSMRPAPPTMEEITAALLGMDESMQDIDAQFRNLSSWSVIAGEIDGLSGAIERLVNPSVRDNMGDFVAKVITLGSREGNDERERLVDQFNKIGESLALMVGAGNAELAASQFELLAAEWERAGGNVEDLMELLPSYDEALTGIDNEQKAAAESAQMQAQSAAVLAQNLEATYGSLEGYAAALGLSEEATEKLIEDSNALGESLASFVDPLGVYTGYLDEMRAANEETARKTAEDTEDMSDSWEDYVKDVDFSFEEYMQRLRDQVKAQEDWQTNMLILAGRVSEGTIAELAAMGVEGAGLVAELVTRSDAELDEFDDLAARRAKEATDAWGAQLTMAQPVLAAIGRKAGADVVAELAAQLMAGTVTVAQLAERFGINLAGGINPLLTSLGRPTVKYTGGTYGPNGFNSGGGYAEGAVVDFYASGGMRENHVAQIAPAGAWRVWAEPETGGEAYIPLSPEKRGRSVDIWRQVGDRLGVQFQEFAFGGINDVPRPPSTAPYQPPISTAGDATMRKAYDEITAWLAANLEPASGGSAAGLLPIMAAARQYVMDTYGVRNIGGFARRNIAGTNVLSDHALGKAIDIMTSNRTLGWAIANDFAYGPAHSRFNTENVIWQQSISTGGGPFRRMADRGSPTQNHMDHVHVDKYAQGALVDFFKKGGPFNPHVRDAGGPLLPGYTYNGLGRPEWVSPNPPGPMTLVGELRLDSGEFLGTVRGVATAVMDAHEGRREIDLRSHQGGGW
jgi:hypothetical protein